MLNALWLDTCSTEPSKRSLNSSCLPGSSFGLRGMRQTRRPFACTGCRPASARMMWRLAHVARTHPAACPNLVACEFAKQVRQPHVAALSPLPAPRCAGPIGLKLDAISHAESWIVLA